MAPRKIDNRRDILLLLLYSPGIHDKPNEPISGRTRLVKMLFLFREEVLPEFRRGVEITDFYEFFAWSYGPFSRQVYDDLQFFTLRGFIRSTDASEDTLPESLAEWDLWLSGSAGNSDDQGDVVDYREEQFSLTDDRGVPFTSELFAQLSGSQQSTLRHFKKQMLQAPLRSILKYVYEKYPEKTDKSTIKEQVLGSG